MNELVKYLEEIIKNHPDSIKDMLDDDLNSRYGDNIEYAYYDGWGQGYDAGMEDGKLELAKAILEKINNTTTYNQLMEKLFII